MNTSEKFCLKWNNFTDNISTTFGSMREDTDFSDVTLACEDGQQVEAHKVILAASSPFFHNLLRRNKHTHPLIYMRGVNSEDLLALADFLYHGEANVSQENLDRFLALAEELKLKVLGGVTNDEDTEDIISSTQTAKQRKTYTATKEYIDIISPFPYKQESSYIDTPQEDVETFQDIVTYQEGTRQNKSLAIIKESFSGELQELDEKVKTMWAMSKQKGVTIYTCNVCGKEAKYSSNIRDHIEANHLEGVSLPCNICHKIFRSKASLRMHKHKRNHK